MKMAFECVRDHLTIRGYEYREAAGKLPALILCHGFLANQSTCHDYACLAAGLGYAAFTFDFNGGGLRSRSDGKSIDMTVLTEVADLKAVISHIRTLDDVNVENISLLGLSQGGVVCALVAKSPDVRIHKLLLLYPALCIPDDARAGKMMFARFDPDNIPPVIQHLPMKLSGAYAKSVITWGVPDIAGGFDGPVLLLHGTADRIVNIRYAREAAQYYPAVEYHEITGGEHMFRGEHESEARNYISAFLRKQ